MRRFPLTALLATVLSLVADAADAPPAGPGPSGPVERAHGIVVCPAGSGAAEALCLGRDGVAEAYAQDAQGSWHRCAALPGSAATPLLALARAAGATPGVLALRLADGQPGLLRRLAQGWSAFEPLPNPALIPYAALATSVSADGFRHLILLGRQDGQPYLIMRDPATRAWIPFGALVNPARTPFRTVAIGARSAGQVPAVLLGRDDGQPYLIRQRQSGSWGAVEALPDPAGTPYAALAIATGSDGYTQVIAIGRDDGQPYLIWQDAVTGRWNDYGAMANPQHTRLAMVAAGRGSHQLLEAVCLGRDDGRLYHASHSQYGKWGPLEALPGSGPAAFTALAAGSGEDGTLLVIAIGRTDGEPYLIRQEPTTGAWSAPERLANAARASGAVEAGRTDDF